MVVKAVHVKQGDLSGGEIRAGVRAPIVARKRSNVRGAKGAQEGGYVKAGQTEGKPAAVLEVAKQAGEIRARWAWVEPSVWTERMLTALEQGVKGGVWFSLIDKVWSERNLRSAFAEVKANKGGAGVDHQTIEMFESDLEGNLQRLAEELRGGRYEPREVRRCWIPKPGSREKRPLGIPAVRDRVVQAALRHVLEPIFERDFAECSYGFRPGRGSKDALREVDRLLKNGYHWAVDVDIKGYFDSIDHERLLGRVTKKVADGRVLELVGKFLKQGVMDGLECWTPERGTPQGAVISPLLSNIYLDSLDHRLAERGLRMVRYADDFVVLCGSREEAEEALALIRQWMEENRLEIHSEKTKVVDARPPGGFDFLGYHFEQGRRWPRRKSLRKFKDAVRAKTRRANGHSLEAIIAEVNRTLVGWFEYFKHSYWTTFAPLDGWIRMRLRSILRKRHGRRGRGRGLDHRRWPNAFFVEQGLFSLQAAHVLVCQSSWRRTADWRAGCGKSASPVRREG